MKTQMVKHKFRKAAILQVEGLLLARKEKFVILHVSLPSNYVTLFTSKRKGGKMDKYSMKTTT